MIKSDRNRLTVMSFNLTKNSHLLKDLRILTLLIYGETICPYYTYLYIRPIRKMRAHP